MRITRRKGHGHSDPNVERALVTWMQAVVDEHEDEIWAEALAGDGPNPLLVPAPEGMLRSLISEELP